MKDDAVLRNECPAEVADGPNKSFLPEQASGRYDEGLLKNRMGDAYSQRSSNFAESYGMFERRVVQHQASLNVAAQLSAQDQAFVRFMISEGQASLSRDLKLVNSEHMKISALVHKYSQVVAKETDH